MEEKLSLDSESSLQRNRVLHSWDDIFSNVGGPSFRAGVHAPLPTNPSSVISSDSGLSSYESQFSCYEELLQMRPNHLSVSNPNPALPAGDPRYGASHSCYPPNFSAYSSLPMSSPLQHYSLPANLQQSSWTYPLYIQQTHASSLPEPVPCHSFQRSPDGYGSQSDTSQEEREEVRRKLYAIFNPYHVDRVLEMFPELKDAQQLAAEVLKLKSRGGLFPNP